MEIRGRNLSSGPCWLGCHGTIYGHCFLGSPILIDSIEVWRGLRHRHRVEVDELPYKTTYGFPVHQCRRVTLTSYEHPRGAVGIVRFHRASSRHKAQRPPPPLVASRSSSAVIRGVGQAEEGALLVVPHSSLVLVCASSRLCLNRRPKHSAAP